MLEPTVIRELIAELELLELYDRLRARLGHDYGGGQRRAEIHRRRLYLRERGVERVTPADVHEVAAAFERVGRPKVRRLEVESFRKRTPATHRTATAWRELERELAERAA